MALPVKQQLTYWSLTAIVFLALLWVFGDVLLPFILGGIIAYFLDPVADRLEALGLTRIASVAIIVIIAILIIVPAGFYVVRSILAQAAALYDPDAIATIARGAKAAGEDATAFAENTGAPSPILERTETILSSILPSLEIDSTSIKEAAAKILEYVRSKGAAFAKYLQNSAASIVNIATLMLIVPVVSVYMLLDWDRMIARIDGLLPRDHAPTIRRIFSEIDATLAAFVRGMGSVCLILGCYYAIALVLVGLKFGLIVGCIAGLITFIPYIGSLFGGALAIGLALVQFWGEWQMVGIVAAIFVSGQVIEGNYLTPKLVGESVGLHPVWLLLSLSAFGSLFGFVGLLVAVPVAASLGVVIRFATRNYLDSRLYKGLTAPDPDRG